MIEKPLTAAAPSDVIEALAFALRYNRSGKRSHDHDAVMARAAAEHLAEALRRGGFVLMKRPPAPDHVGADPPHARRLDPPGRT